MNLTWTQSPWPTLERDDLYDLITLRQIVFCIEQNCVYLDCDGVDRRAVHLLGRTASGDLVAYARLMDRGIVFDETSIGRVVTHPWARRSGAGRALMAECIVRSELLFGKGPIRIGAQRYLERFYGDFGFVTASEPYLEDGIPHIEMLRA